MKLYVCALVSIFIAVCSQAQEPLRLGVLLIEDSVPLYVAEKEELYGAHGVDVELIPFLSALERDSALTAGAIDGAVSDPVGALLFDRGRGIIKITSLLLGKTPEEGVFAILSSPDSNLYSVDDLKNVAIAVSNATIIEYVTERLLEDTGFLPSEIHTIEVRKMAIRMQMLLADSVKAATLPEPLASIAASRGAHVLLRDSDGKGSLSQTVIIFRTAVLENRLTEVQRFFGALSQAVDMINTSPETFRELFVEKSRLPPFLAEEYAIPRYPEPEPFDRMLYGQVSDWLISKKLIEPIPYSSMVAADGVQAPEEK